MSRRQCLYLLVSIPDGFDLKCTDILKVCLRELIGEVAFFEERARNGLGGQVRNGRAAVVDV
jgi:hypothetical protein